MELNNCHVSLPCYFTTSLFRYLATSLPRYLFRCNPVKEKRNKPKNNVGDPYSDQWGEIAKGGKNSEDLHEQDVDKGERQTQSKMKSDSATDLSA
jgi:hypothetical protein